MSGTCQEPGKSLRTRDSVVDDKVAAPIKLRSSWGVGRRQTISRKQKVSDLE